MRRFAAVALGAVAFCAFASIGQAIAADIPLKAPPPPPWYDWTGFYVGLNGGYSWGRSATNFSGTTLAGTVITPFSSSESMDGWLGGGQIGYNWQFNRNWLLGAEADIQATGQRGSDPLPTVLSLNGGLLNALVTSSTTTATLAQKLPWFGTARLRLGIEPSDHWLIYATGGLAFGEVDSTLTASTTTVTPAGTGTTAATSSVNATRAGWTVGGGAEWLLTPAWSAKAEYLYMDFGTVSAVFSPGLVGYSTLNTSSHITDNIARVGIDYHFGR
jgi:outer membrane immunogenic protein